MKNYHIKEIDKHGNVFYLNEKDQYHRIDGPAFEYVDGYKCWCVNGKMHREDGPAIEYSNREKSYYLNNRKYIKSEFMYLTKYKETYKYNI